MAVSDEHTEKEVQPMKKRTLLLVASLIVSLAIATTGTLAYLTDTDEDVNVMTLGNVQIEQHEMKRADGVAHNATLKEGDLVPFVDGIKLYPAYPKTDKPEDAYEAMRDQADSIKWGTYVHDNAAWNGLWSDDNLVGAVDKMIFVENTGTSDAYVRTLIAVESPEGVKIGYGSQHADIVLNMNGNNRYTNGNGVQSNTSVCTIEVGGTTYEVYEFCYSNAMKPGEWTRPSLLQVVMTNWATNDTVALLGDTYEILALSQGVQVTNMETLGAQGALDTAFGKVNVENATKWFSEMAGLPVTTVSTADELTAALAEGGTVVLMDDITVNATQKIAKGQNVVLNLNGNNLSYAVANSGASAIINNAGTLEIAGEGTISFVAENPDLGSIPAYATNTISNTGTLTIGEGVVVTNDSDGGASYAVDNHGVFYLNGGTLKAKRCALRIAKYNQDNVVFVMNAGLVEGATPAWIQLPSSNPAVAPKISVTINDGTFKTTKDTSADNNIFYTYSYGNSHANTSITINGGEFLGGTVSTGSGYKGDAPTMTINGGTFEYDVLQWLEGDTYEVLYNANK